MSGVAGKCSEECTPSLPVRESNGIAENAASAVAFLTAILDGYECKIDQLKTGQDRIENQLAKLTAVVEQLGLCPAIQQPIKEWYTPAEAAAALGKRPYTVREWCRLQRINARKRSTGRGEAEEWEISAAELDRYRNHGLLPTPTKY